MSIKSKISFIKTDLKQFYKKEKSLTKLKKAAALNINAKPKVLNLNIIDICNSKCTMCNIWKQEEALDITPEQLTTILNDPFYSELKHVGVTGGEPTLRNDLPAIYESIIKSLPNLKGVSIITNAIIEEDVKRTIKNIKTICKKHDITFSVMVSIDGYGEMHDKVRGVKGNFESAINVYKFVENELKLPITFGCTISKINVWGADDLLYYAKKHNMKGRFRIAETINRLYNENRGKVIRNFNEDETYHLVLFFEKLKRTFEDNKTYKRTYSSIQNMLLGGERLIGCPYHNDGIVLGSQGQLNYCAPKATDIGNVLKENSASIYRDNFDLKKEILAKDCKNCIHDYHAPITPKEREIRYNEERYAKYLRISNAKKALAMSMVVSPPKRDKNSYMIFIFGWYGTETVGDKAILGGIISHYKEIYHEKVKFVIGSLYPFITERTCKELNIEATVVSTRNFDLLRYSKIADEVVMGGGPLMDLEELYVPYIGFLVAKKYNRKTTIFGCGIGPVKKPKYFNTIKSILELTDDIKLRDQASVDALLSDFNLDKAAELSGDPAKEYIKKIDTAIVVKREPVICCFLREWTFEYFMGTKEDFIKEKDRLEFSIASFIKRKATELGVQKIELHNMHNFVLGNDDRDFSRSFIEKYFQDDDRIWFDEKLATPASIVEAMKKSELNICMRFHSVLFAHTLNTQFAAIDYTLGGKILNYLTDNNAMDQYVSVKQLIEENFTK